MSGEIKPPPTRSVETEQDKGRCAPASCSALTVKDILPGRCYEAKRPARIGYPPLYNDRQVKWVSSLRTEVQYDSPTVADGRHYPKVSMEKFLKWAGRNVTAIMPKGEWRAWRELCRTFRLDGEK